LQAADIDVRHAVPSLYLLTAEIYEREGDRANAIAQVQQFLKHPTDRQREEIDRFVDPAQTHPREAKEVLGKDIVRFYHGPEAATAAAEEWRRQFTEQQDPTEIREVLIAATELTNGKMNICRLLVRLGLAKSNNEARRLLGPNSGVTIGPEREKITDHLASMSVVDGLIVRVGNRRIARVRIN